MKRGIPIVLQAAGTLLVCLATSLNHPVHALGAAASMYDTAHYYNEQGEEIFCYPKALKPGNFVIRTCKKKKEIYYDYNSIGKNKSGDEPIKVKRIGIKKAKRVELFIIKGMVTTRYVKRNLVEILDKGTLRKMRARIGDSGENLDKIKDYREYGGVVMEDSTLISVVGDPANPCDTSVGVNVPDMGLHDFHSHPSGEIFSANGDDCVFAQGPSAQDQSVLRGGFGYVFGMSKRSHLIYIYDKRGVLATLPFCFLLCDGVNK